MGDYVRVIRIYYTLWRLGEAWELLSLEVLESANPEESLAVVTLISYPCT